MNKSRTADLQRCVLAATLLLCLYLGSAFVALRSAFSPAVLILAALGIGALVVLVGLWQLRPWVWHPAHILAWLGILLGVVSIIQTIQRFGGGLLDLPVVTLIILVSVLLLVFLRRRDVRRALGR